MCAGMAVLILFLVARTFGQSYFYNHRYFEPRWLIEGGIFTGVMNCLTDLGGSGRNNRSFMYDLNARNSQITAGGFLQVTCNHVIGLRIQVTFGSVKAYDSILQNGRNSPGSRYSRNLHFKSTISEISFITEIHPQSFVSDQEQFGKFQYFVLAGIGRYHFNPKAHFNGKWIELQPLHTEGQGLFNGTIKESYKRSQWNIQAGGGVRFELNARFHIRCEMVNRILFTDYLDDVSTTYADPSVFFQSFPSEQAILAKSVADRRFKEPGQTTNAGEKRGNPGNNDTFFHFGLSFSYLFNRRPL